MAPQFEEGFFNLVQCQHPTQKLSKKQSLKVKVSSAVELLIHFIVIGRRAL